MAASAYGKQRMAGECLGGSYKIKRKDRVHWGSSALALCCQRNYYRRQLLMYLGIARALPAGEAYPKEK